MKSIKLTLIALFSVVMIMSSCSNAKYGSMTRRVKHQKVEQIAKADRHENVKKEVVSNEITLEEISDEEEVVAIADNSVKAEKAAKPSKLNQKEITKTERNTTFAKSSEELPRFLKEAEAKLAKKPVARAIYKKAKEKAQVSGDAQTIIIIVLIVILVLVVLSLILSFLPRWVEVILWIIILILLIFWLMNYM